MYWYRAIEGLRFPPFHTALVEAGLLWRLAVCCRVKIVAQRTAGAGDRENPSLPGFFFALNGTQHDTSSLPGVLAQSCAVRPGV